MPALTIGLGETLIFGVTAVAMIALAVFGLLIAKKAVYTTLSVIFVMVGFAILYTALEAPFNGMVQIVVYTGAILMMFLFVLMLIGVDSADSGHETLKGQRVITVIGALGVGAVLVSVVLLTQEPQAIGLAGANGDSNPVAVAQVIFSNNVLTLQLTGTLLIVAALGAMTLTHRDRVKKRVTQEEVAHQKMRDFTASGAHPGNKPNSGVYAESNSSTNPALTSGGRPVEISTNRVLQIRGQVRTVGEISPKTVERIVSGQGIDGPSTYGKIGRASIAGMPGESAPDHEGAFKRVQDLESHASPLELDDAGPQSSDIVDAQMIDSAEKTEQSHTAKHEGEE